MNPVMMIYILSVTIIILCMTYVVYTMYTSRPTPPPRTIDHFDDLNQPKPAHPSEKVSDPEYKIREIEHFLTDAECDRIIALSKARLEPSKVYSNTSDVYDTKTRKSEQAWLKDDMDPVIASISKKVASSSQTPIGHQEDLQVVSYSPGGFFTPHYDACDGQEDFCKRMDGVSGPRLFTYLIYLNDDYEGGETVFPKLNITVKPKKGKCVIFQNTLPQHGGKIPVEALHGGNPVTSGNKWICNKWIRVNPFVPSSSS